LCFGINKHIRWPTKIVGIIAAPTLIWFAYLHYELTIHCKFQDLTVSLPVPGEPNEALSQMDPVF
jgi:hypothetical protein